MKNDQFIYEINKAEKLGQESIEFSSLRGWKFPFRNSWIGKLKRFYNGNTIKSAISMSDLPDNFRVILNEEGKNKLKQFYQKVTPYDKEGCRYLYGRAKSISIFSLKRILGVNNSDLESFEPFVQGIKLKSSKILYIKTFPIRFDNKEVCALLGLFPDLNRKNLRTTFKDEYLSNKVLNSIKNIGKIEISAINGSELLASLISLSGLVISNNQLEANNPVPIWLFSSKNDLIKSYLSSLFDAEGCINKISKSIYLTQGIVTNNNLKTSFETKYFSEFDDKEKETILNSPPLLLISVLLLLRSLRIEARLRPRSVYKRKLNDSNVVVWNLEIYGYQNLLKFYRNINFGLPRKNIALLETINSYKRLLRQKNEGYNQVLRISVKLKYPTRRDLSKTLNRSIHTIDHFIKLMKKNNHLRVHHKEGNIAYFLVTDKGINFNKEIGELVDDNRG